MAKTSDSGIPGIGALNTMMGSMDFVKKAWSSFNLPANLAPTMDVDELDKRIADLRAVEQWLNVNLSMLRGTIQGLEVQRGTLAAVQAFGRAVTGSSDAMAQLAQAARARPAATASPAAPSPSPQGPFTRPSAAGEHGDDHDPDEDEDEDVDDDDDHDDADDDHDDDHEDDERVRDHSRKGDAREGRGAGGERGATGRGQPGRPSTAAPAAASGADVIRRAAGTLAAGLSEMQAAVPLQLPSGTQMVSPAAWWNLLQGQFNQVAQAALSGAGVLAEAAGAGGAKPRTEAPDETAAPTGRKSGRAGGPAGQARKAAGKLAAKPPVNPARARPRTAATPADAAPRKRRAPARKPPGS